MKEKILEILHSHSYNVEDQAGNHLIVVDDDSWDAVATEVKNCSIPDVSQQRELLLAYERYKEKYPLIGLETDEWKIDKFLNQL